MRVPVERELWRMRTSFRSWNSSYTYKVYGQQYNVVILSHKSSTMNIHQLIHVNCSACFFLGLFQPFGDSRLGCGLVRLFEVWCPDSRRCQFWIASQPHHNTSYAVPGATSRSTDTAAWQRHARHGRGNIICVKLALQIIYQCIGGWSYCICNGVVVIVQCARHCRS